MITQWTQHDLHVNGVQLHYYRTGQEDKPPLILIHGFSDNGLCWTPVARELEAEYDVIMPDMRGHGRSARVQAGDTVDMAADVAALIRTLGVSQPVVVGHSMGAMVTYQIGVRFPELARALVLEDPPWWLTPPAPPVPSAVPAENPIVTWAKSLPTYTAEELLAQYHKEHPTWPDDLVRPMVDSKHQLDQGIVGLLADKIRSQEVDWQTTIQTLARPLLLVVADPQLGAIVTPAVVAHVRALNPDVEIATIPDVGHLIRFDNPAAFMAALRSFLKRVMASAN